MPENKGMTEEEAEEAREKGKKVRTVAGGREYNGKIVGSRREEDEGVSFIFEGSAVDRQSERIRLIRDCWNFRPVRR